MPLPSPTVDELIATIQRSTLPTVFVEGIDDRIIYRWMESHLANSSVDFVPCDSRTKVLSIFKRRAEFKTKQVAFVADSDMWVFTGLPPEFSDVIFTSGYSIENDVLSSGTAEALFESEEKISFARVIASLTEWFSLEVSRCIQGNDYKVDIPIRQIIDESQFSLLDSIRERIDSGILDRRVSGRIRSEPGKYIRGKNLLDAYLLILHNKSRDSRYSRKAILEMCVKIPGRSAKCDEIVNRIRGSLGLA